MPSYSNSPMRLREYIRETSEAEVARGRVLPIRAHGRTWYISADFFLQHRLFIFVPQYDTCVQPLQQSTLCFHLQMQHEVTLQRFSHSPWRNVWRVSAGAGEPCQSEESDLPVCAVGRTRLTEEPLERLLSATSRQYGLDQLVLPPLYLHKKPTITLAEISWTRSCIARGEDEKG